MRVALITIGRVSNVILADSVARAQQFFPDMLCVALPDNSPVGPGWATPDNGTTFAPPPPVAPAAPDRRITRLAFRSRFTAAEKVTLEIASLDNPQATMAQRQQAASLRVYLADVDAANWIDLDRPDTRAGVQSLQAAGLLAAGRAAAILDAPILETERPTAQMLADA